MGFIKDMFIVILMAAIIIFLTMNWSTLTLIQIGIIVAAIFIVLILMKR